MHGKVVVSKRVPSQEKGRGIEQVSRMVPRGRLLQARKGEGGRERRKSPRQAAILYPRVPCLPVEFTGNPQFTMEPPICSERPRDKAPMWLEPEGLRCYGGGRPICSHRLGESPTPCRSFLGVTALVSQPIPFPVFLRGSAVWFWQRSSSTGACWRWPLTFRVSPTILLRRLVTTSSIIASRLRAWLFYSFGVGGSARGGSARGL